MVKVSPRQKIVRVGSISCGISFIYRGVTYAYDLRKVFQGWQYAWNFTGMVLRGFSLLLIEIGFAHFLKYDPLSVWALTLNQIHPPHPATHTHTHTNKTNKVMVIKKKTYNALGQCSWKSKKR